MEEADALCNRIGIITQGVLRTVGTQQKLKKAYGNGYFLSLNLQI
jgi:ABC-type multidrug transport system ATPase subunit